ncbi:MAG: hypothetical protein ICV81_03840 [Flavisolibacter sp.]|nr:hypothetical protein [Flavisolibacter sp.]
MRRLLSIFFFASFLLSHRFAGAQNADNPGAYMTAISNAQSEMNQKYMAYMSAAAHERRARKVEKLRLQVLESITNSRYKTIEVSHYKGDNTLRQSSLDYIKLCYNVFNEDYNRIVNMEEIAEQSFDAMQAFILLQEKTAEKIQEATEKMTKAEKDFAAKYNVTLVEGNDELSRKLEVSGKLNRYRDQVFLIFFKCNWQDGELTKAINAKKVNDTEQACNSLIRYADEGLQALEKLEPFNGDPALAIGCRQVLRFYKEIAEKDVPKIIEFILKEEAFTKMKKTFEAQPAARRTQQDVDAFNKSVNEINAQAKTFNKLNDDINKGRNKMLQMRENADKAFADKHMPYYK